MWFNATSAGAAPTARDKGAAITSIDQFLQNKLKTAEWDCSRVTKLHTESRAAAARPTARVLFGWTGRSHADSIG